MRNLSSQEKGRVDGANKYLSILHRSLVLSRRSQKVAVQTVKSLVENGFTSRKTTQDSGLLNSSLFTGTEKYLTGINRQTRLRKIHFLHFFS